MRVFCFSVSLSAVGVVGTSDFGHSYIYVVESNFNLSFTDDVSCGASFLFFFHLMIQDYIIQLSIFILIYKYIGFLIHYLKTNFQFNYIVAKEYNMHNKLSVKLLRFAS